MPELLPSIPDVRRIAQSLAMLDALISPDWEDRYYSFNASWGPGEQMASMRDGSGDDWFLLLDSNGAALKGFAHELADDDDLAQRIQDQVPKEFSSFLSEPAFSMQYATFCYWRKADEGSWNKISSTLSDDGSDDLLALLVSGPSGYLEWAADYYEVVVPLEAVSAVFGHAPLNVGLIRQINPEADVDLAYTHASEIGYPVSVRPSPSGVA